MTQPAGLQRGVGGGGAAASLLAPLSVAVSDGGQGHPSCPQSLGGPVSDLYSKHAIVHLRVTRAHPHVHIHDRNMILYGEHGTIPA